MLVSITFFRQVATVIILLTVFGSASCSKSNKSTRTEAKTSDIVVMAQRKLINIIPTESVYRATLPDHLADAKNSIDPTRPFRVQFDIGVNDSNNILQYPPLSKEAKAALYEAQRSSKTIDFQVSLICRFCTNISLGTRAISVSPGSVRSTLASWTVSPSLIAPHAAALPSKELQFVVTSAGAVQDTRSSEIGFAGNASKIASHRVVCSINKEGLAASQSSDVIIRAIATGDGISMNITVNEKELESRIGKYIRDKNGRPLDLPTGLVGWSELSGRSAEIYRELESEVNNIAYLRHAGQPIITSPAQFSLSKADSDKASKEFYLLGSRLYSRLFQPGTALSSVMIQLEQYGNLRKISGDPLRITIISPGGYLPWQMLHSIKPGSVDNEEFWGFKFYLSVYPVVPRSCGQIPSGPTADPDKLTTLFLGYNDANNSTDDVSLISQQFANQIPLIMDNVNFFRKAFDKLQFEKALNNDNGNIGLIITYTHAQSGVRFDPAPNGGYIEERDANGPALIPATDQFITSNNIADAANAKGSFPYLAGRPIVFLDGCESGTVGGVVYANGSPLPDVFIGNGASAVIAAEASIWSYFGYGFGMQLLHSLKDKPVDQALYEARRDALHLSNNPFGLLFSLYGNGSSSVSF